MLVEISVTLVESKVNLDMYVKITQRVSNDITLLELIPAVLKIRNKI